MKKNVLKVFKYKRFLLLSAVIVALVLGVVLFRFQKADGKIKEIGDHVYSKEVMIKTGSGDDDYETISEYSGFDWKNIESLMNKNVIRLRDEYGKSIDGSFTWGDVNPRKKPEGQVWVTSNTLTIDSPIEINGKATIIIESGDLKINADMSYATDKSSIGFIVMNGNIEIADDVSTVGAYYASNEIIFN